MLQAVVRVVDVYPYRVEERGAVTFLLLRRAKRTAYAGQWRMIGGKIEAGEAAWQAALRELEEETGCRPVRFWAVPSVNAFYEWHTDRLNLVPAFAAQVEAPLLLDREHDAYGWFSSEAAVARLTWPEQRRLLHLIAQLLGEGVPAELEIDYIRGM